MTDDITSAYSRAHCAPIRGEICLWRAVLLQAVQDAASQSRRPETLRQKQRAKEWLNGASEDFRQVCDYAGVDWRLMRRCALSRRRRRRQP